MQDLREPEASTELDVAIIGMAGRFPGANNVQQFWENIRSGVESISFFSDDELREAGIAESVFRQPNYVRARGIIENVDKFDAAFFNYFPKEAELLDPQHRIFLECAWEALESAGYYGDHFDGLISLFGGVGMNTYILPLLSAKQGKIDTAEGYQVSIGNEKDFLTTKVSYKLNLHGISLDVQTACSTSLTATFLAYQSLINFQSDMALAGGCTIYLPQKSGFSYQEGMILSPDGHCRAFDARANGTTAGNGCGVVLLKRLEDALADNDHIYAVIKGGAANNDGSQKVGYTAPSIDGQAQVIAEAQYVAGIEPDQISYVETHGTGTNLGDPVEITALTKAFRHNTQRTQFCAIGSVKPNIGHLDAAAGVASLIKTAMALKNKEIPPSINFSEPNPKIDFENSPFFVNTELRPWESDQGTRIAGVSSFGIGGTNVHLILQEPPRKEVKSSARDHHLVLLSARSEKALSESRKNLVTHLKAHEDLDLADVAFTLQKGRKGFGHRLAVVCDSRQDAIQTLEKVDPQRIRVQSHDRDVEEKGVAFMFSGQGAQYPTMARDLYEKEDIFRESVDECCNILHPLLDVDLRELLYPEESAVATAAEKLQQTRYTQPALFVTEYALAELWRQWGVDPQAMIGHSIGEYVAACLSGVLSLKDALGLVALRGELMQGLPAGAMLSIPLSEADARKYENDDVSIAALNADDLSVLSGPFDAIEAVEKKLAEDGIEFTRLHTSHAFHSKMMEPILQKFKQEVARIELHPPEIPYLSNVSGTWITPEQATDPQYYADHIRSTVKFSQGLTEMMSDYDYIFLEVGPGKTLATLARRTAAASGTTILTSVRHPKEEADDQAFILNTLGQVWLAGAHVDWTGFNELCVCKRVPLPTYPFERERYWLDIETPATQPQAKPDEKIAEIEKWFYAPTWERAISRPQFNHAGNEMVYLIFYDGDGRAMQRLIAEHSQIAIFVRPGQEFKAEKAAFTVRPTKLDDYKKMLTELKQAGRLPRRVLHAWTLGKDQDSTVELGLNALLSFVKAFEAIGENNELDMVLCSNGAYEVTGSESINPPAALLAGSAKVIPQEYPNISCRFVDAAVTDLPQVLAEFEAPATEVVAAYRHNHRWLQSFKAFVAASNMSIIRKNGVYLITGGLGDIGLSLGEHLADLFKANLVLVDRISFPEQEEWQRILSQEPKSALSQKIRRIMEIEKHSEVLILKADVADKSEMAQIFDWIEEHVGQLNGIIHAAGLVGSKATVPIQSMDEKDVSIHLETKVKGSQVLAELVSGRKVDFVLLQSSLSTILGGMGMFAYAGANAFMDALAALQNRDGETMWLSVNWDGWRFAKEEEAAPRTKAEILAIAPQEGLRAFELLFQNTRAPQVAISTADLNARLDKWVRRPRPQEEKKVIEKQGSRHPRPKITTPYAEPRNDLEKELVELWGELLGIEGIGIYDDFFDLGGHSLLATQLVSRMRDIYKVELPLRDLFESPNIATLSKGIAKARKETSMDETKISELLTRVENMSDEEVKELLKGKSGK